MELVFTYNGTDRKVQHQIENRVGKSFSFFEKVRMGGNGSPQLFVKDFSDVVKPYFTQSLDRKFVNIELRPKGILIYMKNESNDFIAAFPFSDITYKIEDNLISIGYEEFFLELQNNPTKNPSKFWSNFIRLSANK